MRVGLVPVLDLYLNDCSGRDRKITTHEVSPRFFSSFLRSATVSLSQLLERRTVETNDRLPEFTALERGLVAGRRVGNMFTT